MDSKLKNEPTAFMDGTNTPIYAEPANTDTLKKKIVKINANIVSLYHKCFPPSVYPTQFNDPLFTNCSEYHFFAIYAFIQIAENQHFN